MKTRIKMHQMPGDICKQEKIQMMEHDHESPKRSKAYRKMIQSREKAVLRERTQQIISNQLTESIEE